MVKPTKGDFQPPWSDRGWYADESNARASELEALIESQEGRFRSRSHRHDRPGLAVSPVMHNPYLNIAILPPALIGVGIFLLDKLHEIPWVAIPLVGLMWLAAVGLIGISVLRIPAWHRARRIARDYVRTHGGKIPLDLRWHS